MRRRRRRPSLGLEFMFCDALVTRYVCDAGCLFVL